MGILERGAQIYDQVGFHAWATDRCWTRDSGPIFVRNGEGGVAVTNWRFNGWAKYSDCKLDDQVAGRVPDCSDCRSGSLRPHCRMALRIGWCLKVAHRYEWEGHFAHNRGVPPERGSATQSGGEPRATGAGVSRFSWRGASGLAGPRNCRRRHTWACRRYLALYRGRDGGHLRGAEHEGREPWPLAENLARLKAARPSMARSSILLSCRCLGRSYLADSGYRRATRISILQMGWCWFLFFTTLTIEWHSTFWQRHFPTVRSSASTRSIWFGDSARYTA